MDPRLRTLGNGLITCIALAWLGYQVLYGEGMLRIFAAFTLVIGVVRTAGDILDYIRPRPKRRRSRERDGN
ncbi:hypothetical protein [Streptomyces brasiliensis]|uniref:Uncharacterized protein n=1 Tax=Streptomyces brasiliensis TaxID=1954 RepID=A0A917NP11_9ACTN|nr:hypothetical protein [Streptomyces brasiliensis]GGJ15375.1 hypothetical protein GCM10010121_027560 [Streptomyces brasiliensis]